MANVRKIAYDVLARVQYEDAYSALAINAAVKQNDLNSLDSAFLSALVYGVLERRILLDYIIRQYSNIRLKKIETKTLDILRLGVYQLIFMDKVPDNAAVDESVKLCKKLRLYQSAGFVNAVLRSLVRGDKEYRLPNVCDRALYLSVKYSTPVEIVSLWLDEYGDRLTESMLESLIGRAPLTVRVNTLKTTKSALIAQLSEEGVKAQEVPFLPYALDLSSTGSIESLPSFQQGLFYVQDASSQLACELLGAMPGERIADVCSAPGGKSFYSAMRMENRGEVFAYDIHPHKLHLIEDSSKRLGIDIIKTDVRDASSGSPKLPEIDRLLCDVPCSGLGILRRKPEIRYKKDTNIDILPNLQYSILCMNACEIPRGGTVIYSTCTLNPKENRMIADRFLAEHPDFAPLKLDLPQGFERVLDEPLHMLTVLPHRYHTDGFFIAGFRKQG